VARFMVSLKFDADGQAIERGSNRHQVTHLRDKFPADMIDPAWIRTLGEDKDWVIVSADLWDHEKSRIELSKAVGRIRRSRSTLRASSGGGRRSSRKPNWLKGKGFLTPVQGHAIRGRSAPLTHGDL
jgi:PIN like domain